MPRREPKLPPKNEINKSVNSEILPLLRLAFCLSKPKSKKLNIEIVVKNNIIFINKKKKKTVLLYLFFRIIRRFI
jgi:hypothetical protein